MTGQHVQTSQVGALTVTTLCNAGAEGEVYNTNHPAWLVKICVPAGVEEGDTLHRLRQLYGERYQVFTALQWEQAPELACLPQEYLMIHQLPAYLMRRAPGHCLNLKALWSRGLDLSQRYRLARSMASGIAALHTRQVVHADLKEANVFVESSSLHVSILDIDGGGYFGASPFSPVVESLPLYTAPELVFFPDITTAWQHLWQQPDPRKIQPDLWALAVLLYRLLVDHDGPFSMKNPTGDSRYQPFCLADAYRDAPDWPRQWQRERMATLGLDPNLVDLFLRTFSARCRMRIDAPARPSAEEWTVALEMALGGKRVSAVVPHSTPSTSPPAAPAVPPGVPPPPRSPMPVVASDVLPGSLDPVAVVVSPNTQRWRWGRRLVGGLTVGIIVLGSLGMWALRSTAVLSPVSPPLAPSRLLAVAPEDRHSQPLAQSSPDGAQTLRLGTAVESQAVTPPSETPGPAPTAAEAPAHDRAPQGEQPARPVLTLDTSSLNRWRQVQQRLQNCRFAPGPIDGREGPKTQEALRRYQTAWGWAATGRLDESTEHLLLTGPCPPRLAPP